jgi:hypothetical protein
MACTQAPAVPGDTQLGTFDFAISPLGDGCPFEDGGMPSKISGVLSLDSKTGKVFLTIGSASHEGSLDGDRLELSASVSRELSAPCNCSCEVVETIRARVFGESDARLLGSCTGLQTGPTDAGYSPERPDAGLDIRLICGTIRDDFISFEGESDEASISRSVY